MTMHHIVSLVTLFTALALPLVGQAADLSPAEARAIAKEAAVYGFPIIDNYRVNYDYFRNNFV